MRQRRMMIGYAAVALLLLAARHPSADIRILTHDATDLAPHQVKAAFDLGVASVSLLVTWTGRHLQ